MAVDGVAASSGRVSRTRSAGVHKGRATFGVLFIGPAAVVLAVTIVYPLVRLVLSSLTSRSGASVGLHNYATLFSLEDFRTALWHSLVMTAIVVVVEVAIGLALALAMERSFRGRGVVRTAFVLPWPLPGFVAAYAFVLLLDYNYGFVNHLASGVGLPRHAWLGGGVSAFAAIIAVLVWKTLPWTFLTLSAALVLVPNDIREAAKLDGVSRLGEVRHIILPVIRPVIMLILVLRFIWTFNDFELPFLMTGGGPGNSTLTLPTLTYNLAFPSDEVNLASTVGVILLLILGVFALVYVRSEAGGLRGGAAR
jgi:multiple sugar transport system permease protein